jgi:hypothetical protein
VKPGAFKRWWLPSLVGVAVAVALLFFFTRSVHLKTPPLTVLSAVKPGITFVTPTRNIRDDQGLFDLEPLFLPTEHNASVLTLPRKERREPGSMSFTYPPKFAISESGGGVAIDSPIAVPTKPIEVLNLGEPPNPWPEVGREPVDLISLDHRLGFVEVESAQNGQSVISEPIYGNPGDHPPAEDWAPIEFLVSVDAAGLVGQPLGTSLTTPATTSDEVEAFFRNFLTKQFQLGARLKPGFYTVRIGP